jgi:hypothetical protein
MTVAAEYFMAWFLLWWDVRFSDGENIPIGTIRKG